MLDSLNSETWTYLIGSLITGAVCFAWAADAILGRIGFGVTVTAIIAAGGGYGGLMVIDWAILHQKLPYTYATPGVYSGGAVVAVTLLLIVLCLVKRLAIR